QRWQKNNWIRNKKTGDLAVNPVLWLQLLELTRHHDVTMNWVKGHAGNAENEVCDKLANSAARNNPDKNDTGYKGNPKT
ncbi:MAG: ribonuclease HI, partial [Deltaproteobacteria bacterium]|nr:ribonuclease HI [Deltaproteobacteria bacterium]